MIRILTGNGLDVGGSLSDMIRKWPEVDRICSPSGGELTGNGLEVVAKIARKCS